MISRRKEEVNFDSHMAWVCMCDVKIEKNTQRISFMLHTVSPTNIGHQGIAFTSRMHHNNICNTSHDADCMQ